VKKQLSAVITLLLMVFIVVGCNQKEEEPKEQVETDKEKNEEIVTIAEAFITQLSEGKYDEATENFDETMSREMPASQLREVWTQLESQVGNYIEQEYDSTVEQEGYQIVLIKGLFEGQDVLFSVTIDKSNKVAGFFVR
jgi:outer membrane protein assembly factor BamD (BamD/ComL family)